jgi:hypothetical protein
MTDNANVDETWERFTTLSKAVLKTLRVQGIKIVGGLGGPTSRPVINTKSVCFNGCKSQGGDYETCEILRGGKDRFNFCKTARLPYDVAVVAILAIGEHLGVLTASSDGEASDWAAGLKLASEVCGEPVGLPAEVCPAEPRS